MSNYHPDDEQLQDLLRAAPMGDAAPEELKRRLRVLASGTKHRTTSRWAPRFAFLSACMVVVAALAMLLWPASASAKSFQRVIDATNLVKTFRLAIRVFDGGRTHDVLVQGDEGALDVQGPDRMHVQVAHNEIAFYDGRKNILKVVKLGGMIDGNDIEQFVRDGINQGLSQLDVRRMLEEFKQQYGAQNAKVSDVFEQNGQMVYTIDLESPKVPQKVKITVDAQSDLPIRIQVDGREAFDVRVEYGSDVDIRPLRETVPADAKRFEYDLEKMIQQGMQQLGGANFDKAAFQPDLKEMQRELRRQGGLAQARY